MMMTGNYVSIKFLIVINNKGISIFVSNSLFLNIANIVKTHKAIVTINKMTVYTPILAITEQSNCLLSESFIFTIFVKMKRQNLIMKNFQIPFRIKFL
jgi:hypothetical protein